MKEYLIKNVSSLLLSVMEPARAAPMRAYMRDQFAFLGVPTPQRRSVVKALLRAMKDDQANTLLLHADELWELPQREYQYVALDMLGMHWKTLDASHVPALLALAQRKSWWDTVDGIAAIIGDVLRHEHHGMDAALHHDNLWVRRIAMLHQLGWREQLDEDRLYSYALELAHEKDFFIQKAIGWALRDYARHAPHSVRAFTDKYRGNLSALSYREANKHRAV